MSGTFARPVVIRNRVAVSFRGRTFVLSPHGDYPGFWAVEANELCLSLHPPLGHSQTDVLNFGRERERCVSPPSLTTASTHYRSRDWEVSTPSHSVSKPFIPPRPAPFGDFICVLVQNTPISSVWLYNSNSIAPVMAQTPIIGIQQSPPSSLHPQSILHTTLEFPSWKRSDPWLPQPHCPPFFQLLTPARLACVVLWIELCSCLRTFAHVFPLSRADDPWFILWLHPGFCPNTRPFLTCIYTSTCRIHSAPYTALPFTVALSTLWHCVYWHCVLYLSIYFCQFHGGQRLSSILSSTVFAALGTLDVPNN